MRCAFPGREDDAALRWLDFAPNIVEQPLAASTGNLPSVHWEAKLALEFPGQPEYAEFTENARNPVGATHNVVRVSQPHEAIRC